MSTKGMKLKNIDRQAILSPPDIQSHSATGLGVSEERKNGARDRYTGSDQRLYGI